MIHDGAVRAAKELWLGNFLPHDVDDATEFQRQVAELITACYSYEEPHPMQHLSPRVQYKRIADMSPKDYLSLFIEDDGDVIVNVSEGFPETPNIASVQFCTLQGGGRSPKVREALLRLALAIKEENQTTPPPIDE